MDLPGGGTLRKIEGERFPQGKETKPVMMNPVPLWRAGSPIPDRSKIVAPLPDIRIEGLHPDPLGKGAEARGDVPDDPVGKHPSRGIGIIHDERQGSGPGRGMGPGERGGDVLPLAGVKIGDPLPVPEGGACHPKLPRLRNRKEGEDRKKDQKETKLRSHGDLLSHPS
jgi:hypothetical protein